MTARDIMERLDQFRDLDMEIAIKSHQQVANLVSPDALVAGSLERDVGFVFTADNDGHMEFSLQGRISPPNKSMVRRAAAIIGVDLRHDAGHQICEGRGLHWVIQAGRTQ